jgi:hypothetical protein
MNQSIILLFLVVVVGMIFYIDRKFSEREEFAHLFEDDWVEGD